MTAEQKLILFVASLELGENWRDVLAEYIGEEEEEREEVACSN